MGVFKYEENRNYDIPLTIEEYNQIIPGFYMSTGQGKYKGLEIEGYDGDVKWIAVKRTDGSWKMHYGKLKLPFEYIIFNEPMVEDLELVQRLTSADDEVMKLYRL